MGRVEVLLITSRTTGRWIIPKGNVKKHENLHECARREAFEEAGVSGRIGKRAIGHFEYVKLEENRSLSVSVFQMLVDSQTDDFPEHNLRSRTWFTALEAAKRVDEQPLRDLLMSFEEY